MLLNWIQHLTNQHTVSMVCKLLILKTFHPLLYGKKGRSLVPDLNLFKNALLTLQLSRKSGISIATCQVATHLVGSSCGN